MAATHKGNTRVWTVLTIIIILVIGSYTTKKLVLLINIIAGYY